MGRITKYFGPPGTGKTTTLMNIIEKYLDEGTPPEKIAFISFSVKAAEEGKNRAHLRFGLGFDEMPYFCTSHAFCALRSLFIAVVRRFTAKSGTFPSVAMLTNTLPAIAARDAMLVAKPDH